MYIFETPKLGKVAWILPPKTGTSSIERVVRRFPKSESVGGRHAVNVGKLKEVQSVVANTRNPYDILRSWYDYIKPKTRKANSFIEWLHTITDKSGPTGTCTYLNNSTLNGAEHAYKYMRYEAGMQNEMERLCSQFGIGTPTLEVVGASTDKTPWEHRYTAISTHIVRQKYYLDFLNYGYSM